jgi:hypothetical protein
MKLEMAMNTHVGEAKVHLVQEHQEQRRHAELATAWKKFRQELAATTRMTFVFLFGAALVVYLFCHQAELQQFAQAGLGKISSPLTKVSAVRSLQQNTVSYEKEVDAITP